MRNNSILDLQHILDRDGADANNMKPSNIQDNIHILTKLRNRLLKPSILLPIGNKQVSVSHLKILINISRKDVHGLTLKDICPDDRQNYDSFVKVMDQRVSDALVKNIPDTEATVMFIKICRQIASSLNDDNITPVERLYLIWHSVYFLRGWRKWIKNIEERCKKNKEATKNYSVQQNFITQNAYACIEINAHNLVQIMIRFREENKPELLLTHLFNSQTCEQTFRQFRSMSTANWTKINFGLLELIHLVGRIELQNDIIYFKLGDENILFPRQNKRSSQTFIYQLPSNDEIRNVINKARKDALQDIQKFDIILLEKDVINCELPNVDISLQTNIDDIQFGVFEDENQDSELSELLSHTLNLRDYASQNANIEINANSRFLQTIDKNGTPKVVRKSSLVWLLSSTKDVLSKDRLRRVQECQVKKSSSRSLEYKDTKKSGKPIFISEELAIGEWCLFQYSEKVIVGAVLAFRYLTGRSEKEREYSWDFVPVKPSSNLKKKRGIEVLSTWYTIHNTGKLYPAIEFNNFYINIENYIASIKSPSLDKNGYLIILKHDLQTILDTLSK